MFLFLQIYVTCVEVFVPDDFFLPKISVCMLVSYF